VVSHDTARVSNGSSERLDLASSTSVVSNVSVSADGQVVFLQRESAPSRPPEIWALENFLAGIRR
jgi:hypothetical protein